MNVVPGGLVAELEHALAELPVLEASRGPGSTVEVDFWTRREVREMRTRAAMYCVQPDEIAGEPWQPFAPGKTFPFTPPINWVGFYVTVQFRDSAGNLSPLYCDDISVEGMPPQPTP